ncbi:PREDICTED: uncharacterized protein LOC107328769 isoform X13 [Acropora digitifera]|uniref:uncharacterized protein LOC107328769 isoform X13 n=1 Tax=Acropora digitifera TaxID=70779 RepID=UPI00077B0A8D|nr:PREDICTED: uncharacterized protein LOC107328769 isoform X13 [Acropora digitifera]
MDVAAFQAPKLMMLMLMLKMLRVPRNVFSGCGIVLLVQAHTTLGMAAIIIMAASTTIRIPVAGTVEATHGMAETEIMDLYPTTNKAMLQVQRNVFSGCGIVLLVQAHTTVGMVATVIMAASTTIRIPVADTVEATHGMAETEIMEVYPTTNKAMLQVQRNVFSGIVLLVQAHTTLGMVAIIVMAASTTIRIPVADTVEATHGMAGTGIMDLYPTTNKAMLQVQRNVLSGCGIVLMQEHTTLGMVATVIMDLYPTTNKAVMQVQRNVFFFSGIIVLMQEHITLGMVATVIMVASTTIRIPVADTVEATHEMAGTEIIDLIQLPTWIKGLCSNGMHR